MEILGSFGLTNKVSDFKRVKIKLQDKIQNSNSEITMGFYHLCKHWFTKVVILKLISRQIISLI